MKCLWKLDILVLVGIMLLKKIWFRIINNWKIICLIEQKLKKFSLCYNGKFNQVNY